jgi:hypothetical protein
MEGSLRIEIDAALEKICGKAVDVEVVSEHECHERRELGNGNNGNNGRKAE